MPDPSPGWASLPQDAQDASGLMYRRNRFYDPESGRFTQEDPIGLAGGVNAYGFAEGDPVSYGDPYGLCAQGDTTPSNVCTLAQSRQLTALSGDHMEGAGWADPTIYIGPAELKAAAGITRAVLRATASRVLGRALIAMGARRASNVAAHHIVALEAARAGPARNVLNRFGVDLNAAENGVFLPRGSGGLGPITHGDLHTNVYYDAVNEALLVATSKDHVLQILGRIRNQLLDGTFPR